jgi:hypothetical protein
MDTPVSARALVALASLSRVERRSWLEMIDEAAELMALADLSGAEQLLEVVEALQQCLFRVVTVGRLRRKLADRLDQA